MEFGSLVKYNIQIRIVWHLCNCGIYSILNIISFNMQYLRYIINRPCGILAYIYLVHGTVWWIRFASTTNGALTAPRRLATPTKPKPLFLETKKISIRRLHYEKLVYYYHTAHNYSIQLKSILLPMVYNRIYF